MNKYFYPVMRILRNIICPPWEFCFWVNFENNPPFSSTGTTKLEEEHCFLEHLMFIRNTSRMMYTCKLLKSSPKENV